MTTPSEEEARAEAEARWPQEWFYTEGSTDPNFTPRRIPVEDGRRAGFVEGAMWAASRVSTPLSEDVRTAENIAPGLWLDSWGNVWRMWRDGIFSMLGTPDQDPEQYEPFTPLIPAVPVLPTEPEPGTQYVQSRCGICDEVIEGDRHEATIFHEASIDWQPHECPPSDEEAPAPTEPARQIRECVVCGERVTVSNATETWEERHLHGTPTEPEEADADPDTAFELGRIAGYDEAMREVHAAPTEPEER